MAVVFNPAFDEMERETDGRRFWTLDISEDGKINTPERRRNYRNTSIDELVSCDTPKRVKPNTWRRKYKKFIKYFGYSMIHAAVLIYLLFATLHWMKKNTDERSFDWCNGYGMLLIILTFTYISLCYYHIIKKFFGATIKRIFSPLRLRINLFRDQRRTWLLVKIVFYSILFIGLIAFLIYDTIGSIDRLRGCIGLCTMLAFGFIFSKHPRRVNWRPVIWGLILQFIFGLLIIRWSTGRVIFECFSEKVAKFLAFAEDGASFVFSKEIIQKKVFAFAVLPVIFFFSFVIQILYYWGAMQWIILKFGWALHKIMGTTVCESINSAANTFLGMTEAPLLIKPYISKLTSSEIHAVMCSGFATVSGTVLAAYMSFGAQPALLITASVMSAPAALCFSKLIYPETEKSETTFQNLPLQKSEDTSIMDAATKGALAGIPIVLGIVANIVAFISFVSFLNAILSWLGGLVGFADLSFEYILSKIFMPLSWILGVPWDQCDKVATLIGLKTAINEFVAYEKLGEYKRIGVLSPRAEGIATFAICGFANPGSVGIMVGSLSAMVPEKSEQIAAISIRSFLAGSAVCFMTASIAGILMTDDFYSIQNNGTTHL